MDIESRLDKFAAALKKSGSGGFAPDHEDATLIEIMWPPLNIAGDDLTDVQRDGMSETDAALADVLHRCLEPFSIQSRDLQIPGEVNPSVLALFHLIHTGIIVLD